MVKRAANQSKTNARKATARAKAAREEARRRALADPIPLVADYHHEADGTWSATITLAESFIKRVEGRNPAEALDAAMGVVEAVAQTSDRAIATMHTLDGDAGAWGDLTLKLGLQARVGGRSAVAFLPID